MDLTDEAAGAEALQAIHAEIGQPIEREEALRRWRSLSGHERSLALHAAAIVRGTETGPLNGPPIEEGKTADDMAAHLRGHMEELLPGPKKLVFSEKIAPALETIRAACYEADINFAAFFELDSVKDETNETSQMMITGRVKENASRPMQHVASFVRWLRRKMKAEEKASVADEVLRALLVRRIDELLEEADEDDDG